MRIGLCLGWLLCGLSLAHPPAARAQEGESSPNTTPEEIRRELADRIRLDPSSEELNLAYGLQCLSMESYSHAALAFERILIMNPANDRARIELARACYLLGQMDESRAQFERVLAGSPPPAVRQRIEEYLEAIGRCQSKWRFTGRIESGAQYDGNVNYGPASQIIGIAPISIGTLWLDQLQLAPESEPKSAWGGYAAGTLLWSYQPRFGHPLSFSGYGRMEGNSLDDASEYNLSTVQACGGPRLQWGAQALDMPVHVEYLVRGGDSLATVAGLTPGYYRQVAPKLGMSLTANFDYRDYAESSERDGFFGAFGVQATLGFGARAQFMGGARVIRESPESGIWRNTGWEVFTGVLLTPLDRLSCYGNATFRKSEYDDRESMSPNDRRDEQGSFVVGAAWRFTESWGMNLNVQYTTSQSTFDLYEYDRLNTKWGISYDY